MARRKRYKDLELLMTRILIAVAAVFVLYLIFAGLGKPFLKIFTAIIAIAVSGLSLGFLYLCGEFKKRRSRWIVLGYICTVVCILASLVLNFPSPKPVAPTENPAASQTQVENK